MPSDRTIAHAPWLKQPSTLKLLEAFTASGGRVRFVGGCVRNTLLQETVSDIDLATDLEPQQVVECLEASGLKAVPTGLEHGTITAVVDHHPFEVTTLRADVSTDGRRATVVFTKDWHQDALRRDFTMNAIYADPDGQLFDPLGGVADALERRVIFIGDANQRLREDYLRILRFFRFGAQYGAGHVDEAGLQACIANADGLERLSGERIQSELFKLLAAASVLPIVKLMADARILPRLLPGFHSIAMFEALAAIEQEAGRPPDPVLRLSALLAGGSPDLDPLAERLKLPNVVKARLTAAFDDQSKINVYTDENELKRQFYDRPPELVTDKILLAWASNPQGDDLAYRRALEIAETWDRPTFPLSGTDVLSAGVPEGSEVGQVLSAMKQWWIYQDFAPDREALLSEVRRYLAGSS